MEISTTFSAFSPDLDAFFVSGESLPAPYFSGLYTLRGADGEWLYVGQSKNVPQRLREHERSKSWWRQVADVGVLPLSNPDDRLCAEAMLQLRYRPRHCQAIKLRIGKGGKLTEVSFIPTRRK